jgi:hypothetical protein
MTTNHSWLLRKKLPKADAVNPRNRNTVESPSTKKSAESITLRRAAASASDISVIVMPPI